MKKKENIYKGNVVVTKENSKEWEKKLKNVTKIAGDIIADQGASITIPSPVLAQTGYIIAYQGASITIPSPVLAQTGYIRIESVEELEKQLFKRVKNSTWIIDEFSSDWLISKKFKNGIYQLNNVEFTKEWFLKIKNDKLTPDEVFAIDNIEHRRVAYEFMDKIKMKSLKDYKVLDEVKDDGYGYPMQIVSFTIQNMREPILMYNCHCPSSGREYFLGTDQKTCLAAKAGLIGMKENEVEFINEW